MFRVMASLSMIQKNGFIHFDDWPNADIPVEPLCLHFFNIPVEPLCLHFFFIHRMIENEKLKITFDLFVHEGKSAIIQEKSG